MDFRQVVETAKRILTREKIDRQLAGQTSSTQFMNIRDDFQQKGNLQHDRQYGTENRQSDSHDW